ncbi:MAG: hypothetical protein N2749_03895 [Clostridia bacterium]|nr:hypothetical protein [Clostridia bacterium]
MKSISSNSEFKEFEIFFRKDSNCSIFKNMKYSNQDFYQLYQEIIDTINKKHNLNINDENASLNQKLDLVTTVVINIYSGLQIKKFAQKIEEDIVNNPDGRLAIEVKEDCIALFDLIHLGFITGKYKMVEFLIANIEENPVKLERHLIVIKIFELLKSVIVLCEFAQDESHFKSINDLHNKIYKLYTNIRC